MASSPERGSASVEQAGLAALIALLLLGAIALIGADGQIDAGRGLATAISKRLACAPRLPGACRHHPLVPAYGWPVARLVRALAPAPAALPTRSGLLVAPVDFRRCRHESCAATTGPRLATPGQRTTIFTEVLDRRRSLGWVEVAYWLYRPGLGWQRIARRATQAQVDAASGVRVLLSEDPALVPLETLPGRNHYDFPAAERPPWQWQTRALYPGWSS